VSKFVVISVKEDKDREYLERNKYFLTKALIGAGYLDPPTPEQMRESIRELGRKDES
jgi:hypothetical protein